MREWCLDVPEIVNISVNTPYPGTESWLTEQRRLQTRDYRLFDIQHAVLPTRLPLATFYRELISTQRVLYRKHLNWRSAPNVALGAARCLLRGQTNYVRGMAMYNKVYDVEAVLADHARPVSYEMPLPPAPIAAGKGPKSSQLYIHTPRGRAGRHVDNSTERFVEATRMGTTV